MRGTGQRVVITGASSGIGRATALAFAARGARIALAARNVAGLSSLAAEVEDLGGEALVVPTDVAEQDHVTALATAVDAAFGGVDVWVNNAGVSTYGAVADTEVAEMERVLQVNLLGTVYGTKAALDLMRRDRSGVIVNVASVLGRRAVPLQAAYCAAKHGILGFDEALRLELMDSDPGIHVVDVLPSSMNTPLFTHARSKVGLLPRPIAPVYEPRVVADAIVSAAQHPVRTIYAGGAGRALDVAQRLSPKLVDWYLHGPGRAVTSQLTPLPPPDDDNLDEASVGRGTTTGAFDEEALRGSRYTTVLGTHPGRAPLAVAGALMGTVAVRRRRHRRH
jgi:short-subunit dehydrogenase